MIKIIINKNQCKLEGEELTTPLLQTLDRELSFELNGAKFMPAYQNGWDGKKRFLSKKLIFPKGLLNRVCNIIKTYNLEYEIIDNNFISTSVPLNIDEKLKFINKIPYQYQIDAANKAVEKGSGIIKAATGSGKCTSIDSYHITEDGILNYKDLLKDIKLNAGETVSFETILATPLNKNNTDNSSHIYYDGYGESFYLKSSYGFEIKATPKHKIKILSNDGNMYWKNVNDIKVGDFSIVNYGTNLFGKNEIDLDDAYWYGLLIGDGGLHSNNQIGFYNEDSHILNFAYSYIEKNKLENIHVYKKDFGSETYRAITINSTKYRNQLKDLGFKKCLSINKTLPEFIRKANKKSLAMVLRGIYETDGWVDAKPALCLALSCKEIIDQIHLILLNFGIIASRRVKKTTHEDSHVLTIYREYLPIFIKEIGLDPSGHKFIKLNKYMDEFYSKTENTNTNVIPNQHEKIGKLYKIFKKHFKDKDAPIKMGTVRSWGDKNYWRTPSKNKLAKFINWCKNLSLTKPEYFEAIQTINEIEYLCTNNFFFDKIEFKEKIMTENYDFIIPETHSFVSQGFINHNTIMMALTTAHLNKSTVIYVIGLSLLYQTYNLFISIFGKDHVGIVGDGNCDIKIGQTDINIVSVWTAGLALGIDKKKIINDDEGFEEKSNENKHQQIRDLLTISKVHILDECHICSCSTLEEIAKIINAEHLYGMSASPYSDNGKGEDLIIESILGPIIVDLSASYLIERGFLVQPIIKFINVPKITFPKSVSYPTIYKEYIIESEVRNNIIVEETINLVNKGYKVLVLYKNIKHGKILYDKLKNKISCELLSGKDNNDIRENSKLKMQDGIINCVIASTIFDIGIDWVFLSALVNCGGGKSFVRALQRLGRILRLHSSKKSRTVACVDFIDNCKYLKNHTEARKKIYETEPGFKIIWPTQKK